MLAEFAETESSTREENLSRRDFLSESLNELPRNPYESAYVDWLIAVIEGLLPEPPTLSLDLHEDNARD